MAHDILVVDDEADIRMLLCGILEDEGYRPREAAHADAALAQLASREPNLVVLDIWLQGSRLDGLELLEEIRQRFPTLPVVMISGHGTIETAVSAIKKGAYDFVEKPFKTDRLLLTIDRAIEAGRLKRENEALRRQADSAFETEIIGGSVSMQQLRTQIEKVAPTGSRVLISGPPGSGKEVVARGLHRMSKRSGGPFVALNCAGLHPDRLDEELFGRENGGEDGPRKVGVLERADGGTLLLDEVADMPMATQGKIVRTLQDQSFARLGGTSRLTVDVRVIASTNRDLQEEIQEGRFREDLFYRLAVVPIRVPALSERREDIPELSDHLMERASRQQGLPARSLREDALAALQTYGWPGNVRQLRNVMDWLLIMASGDPSEPIGPTLLPPEVTSSAPQVGGWDKAGEIMTLPLREAREVFEREYLLAQVTRFGGNISRTAEFVGMERSALHRKLKTLGVHGGDKSAKPSSS